MKEASIESSSNPRGGILLRVAAALVPLATYPLWSRFLFYKPLGSALALTAALLIVLVGGRVAFERLVPASDRAAAAMLGLAAYLLYAAAALGCFGDVLEPTGDEPNYLLATISLFRDHDVRLKNNFARKDYLEFYPGRIVTRVVQGRGNGGYPVHGIGVSVYLLPYYYIGSKIGTRIALRSAIRLGMALIAATLAAALFLLLRRINIERASALSAAGFLAFSPPLLTYAHLAYPETSVALLFTLFLLALLSETPRWALCGVLLSLCPWFGVKFNAVAAGLGLTALLAVWLRGKPGTRLRSLLAVAAGAAPSLLAYESYLWRFYGSFSPAAAVGGRASGEKDSVGANLLHYFSFETFKRLRYMPQTFAADLLDQKGGILLYSPALLIALLGIYFLLRQRRDIAIYLCAAPVLHLGLYTYTNYMGGYCPPGRPIAPLLPVITILLALGLAGWRNALTRTMLLALSGAVALLWLVANPMFYHRQIYSEARETCNFAPILDSAGVRVTDHLPVLTTADGFEWRNFAVALGVLALLLATSRLAVRGTAAHLAGLAAVFLPVVLLAASPHVCQRVAYGDTEMLFLDGSPAYPEEQGVWLRGSSAGRLWISSPRPLTEITLPVGDAQRLTFTSEGREIHAGDSPAVTIPLQPSGGGPPYRHEIAFRVEGGFRPSERDPASTDDRWLGAYVRLKAKG